MINILYSVCVCVCVIGWHPLRWPWLYSWPGLHWGAYRDISGAPDFTSRVLIQVGVLIVEKQTILDMFVSTFISLIILISVAIVNICTHCTLCVKSVLPRNRFHAPVVAAAVSILSFTDPSSSAFSWPLHLSSISVISSCVLNRGDKYNLFEHNCNTFSNEVAQFLTGKKIPSYITDLPTEVMST